MALERWDPYQEMLSLRDAMDRLFQESFVRPTSGVISAVRGVVPLDVAETENSFLIRATMPGIKPEEVQITVQGDTVTIRGESKEEQEEQERGGEQANWIMRERRAGSFQRSVTLPTQVNADRAEARFENGILTLTLPKSEEAKPKQIKVGGQRQMETGQGTSTTPTSSAGTPPNVVNQASAESFPASDSPSWTSDRT